MTPKALAAVPALAFCGVLSAPAGATQISIIDESFSGSTVPDGWIIQGDVDVNHDGTPRANYRAMNESDWFGNGYFEMTTTSPGYQRVTAIYERATFSTLKDFSISADVRINSSDGTSGADGMSFFMISEASLELDKYSLSHYRGGMGEWEGTPRGVNTPFNETHFGAYGSTTGFEADADGPNLRGYSWEFDHYQNAAQEEIEYNHMVRLDDWTHMDSMRVNHGPNDDFYEDVGWVSFTLEYSAADEQFTYTYVDRNLAETVTTLSPDPTEWIGFGSVYFGLGAGTGGQVADHHVRNLVVTQAPGPGTLALVAFAPLALLAARRSRR